MKRRNKGSREILTDIYLRRGMKLGISYPLWKQRLSIVHCQISAMCLEKNGMEEAHREMWSA
jgi:hypothetical protein